MYIELVHGMNVTNDKERREKDAQRNVSVLACLG